MAHNKKKLKPEKDNHMIEALRLLRTNMYFIEGKKKRVILCTSTVPEEGKSFVMANYARSVAASGERVLLIDCDIRKPRVHEYFNIEVKNGISDVLLEEKKVEEVIVENIGENLDLLPSQIIKDEEVITNLFLGNNFKKLLEKLKKKYDLILLDSPPLLAASDAIILSKHSDGIIFICGYGMVSKNELVQSKKILTQAGAKLYGVVVNKVDQSGYKGGNYGYYNYSYKYSEEA